MHLGSTLKVVGGNIINIKVHVHCWWVVNKEDAQHIL